MAEKPKDAKYYLEIAKIDTIFSSNAELAALIKRAVDNQMDSSMFFMELDNTTYGKQKSRDIRNRDYERRQYDSLLAAGVDTSQSTYARGLETLKARLSRILTQKGIPLTNIDKYAADIFGTAHEDDDNYINSYLNKFVGLAGAASGGKGADNIALLQDYADDFGIDVKKDVSGTTLGDWLRRLDMGESLEVFKGQIKNMALIGQPESVKKLVTSGMTFKDIYNPTMELINTTLGKKVTLKQAMTEFKPYVFNDAGEINDSFTVQKNLRRHPDFEFTPGAIGDMYTNLKRIKVDMGLEG